MDALAAPDERGSERTAKTRGPGTPTLVSSLPVMIRQATEANKPGTPGRARHKPVNHRAGNAGLSRQACGD